VRHLIMRIALLGVVSMSCNGCPFSMEPTIKKLLFQNKSGQKLELLLNLSYPDSSLQSSWPECYVKPKSTGYVGTTLPLDRVSGLTLFIFDYGYFDRKWHEHPGTPDKYLDEDSILKRFVHSRKELDSLGWRLVYP
jgi:hypothetical protein